jgi:putative copper resistance protein D
LADPLIWVRAVHFASTVSVAGVAFFLVFVGEPAFRPAHRNARVPAIVRARLAQIAWIGLAFVFVSGAAWLVLRAGQMSDLPVAAVFSEGVIWTVLSDTHFGYLWMGRFALTVLLAGAFYPFDFRSQWRRGAAVALAAGLTGTLAFAGHAGAGAGAEGTVHLTADIWHLIAAGAWVGSLVPLALLLHAADDGDPLSIEIAREATRRFSTLGVASVGTLLATGIVNTWVLVGSIQALFGTDYGRLLLVKVALFLGMLSIAAVNRLRLTPRLVQRRDASTGQCALRRLRNNSLIEATVGAIILGLVAVLGTLSPGLNELPSGSTNGARENNPFTASIWSAALTE